MPFRSQVKMTVLAALFAVLSAVPGRAEPLKLMLDWFINPDHAPIIVADQLGYFADVGLDVEIIPPADPSAPPRLVAAGAADIAITYQPELHLQVAAGLPLTRIGTLIETPLNSLIVLKDSGISSIADLKGKKIGYSVTGFEDAVLTVMLTDNGVDASDIELINVNFNLSSSLLSRQVDAVIGAYRNFELTQLEIEGSEGLAFYPEENGVPIYDELVFVAANTALEDPRLSAFMEAIEAATIYLTNHPDESWQAFLKAYPDLDDELNRRAWYDTLPRFSKRPAALDVGRYERFAAFLIERGLIEEIDEVEAYAVTIR